MTWELAKRKGNSKLAIRNSSVRMEGRYSHIRRALHAAFGRLRSLLPLTERSKTPQARKKSRHERFKKAVAKAKEASKAGHWPEAVKRWQVVVSEFDDNAPAGAFRALCRAHRMQGDNAAAEAVLQRGRAKYPEDTRLAIEYAPL